MATRGRKPKPSNLHVINGTKTQSQVDNSGEPRPAPITPQCPEWLEPEAQRVWKALVPELERIGVLTIVDGQALAAACQSWAIYVEMEHFLKQNGRTYAYTNKAGATNLLPRPEVAVGQRALADFRAFCSEFGLTPASRTRINIKAGRGDEADDMEDLLSGGR